jgi:hypothetical protein
MTGCRTSACLAAMRAQPMQMEKLDLARLEAAHQSA